MAEIHIKGKTNGSLVSIVNGRLIERMHEGFNVTGAVGLRRLEIVEKPDAETFTLRIPNT